MLCWIGNEIYYSLNRRRILWAVSYSHGSGPAEIIMGDGKLNWRPRRSPRIRHR